MSRQIEWNATMDSKVIHCLENNNKWLIIALILRLDRDMCCFTLNGILLSLLNSLRKYW